MRVKTRSLFGIFVIFLVVFLFVTYELPYYVYKPGRADILDHIVEVEHGNVSEGDFHLVTVSGGQATPIQYVFAKFLSYHEIVPIEDARPEGITDKEYMHYQLMLMENSQDSSKVVAYEAANKEVTIEYDGVYVMSVVKNMPAEDLLEMGDKIIAVDGVDIETAEQLINLVQDKNVGETVEVKIERDEQELNKTIGIASFPNDDEKVGIGIQLVTNQEVSVDPHVEIKSGNIGGPSAGLMFALEMYNQLMNDDLTKGYKIAGTGEIDYDGNVLRIGGVDKKVVAAHRHGIDIFFVPNENGNENSNYEIAKQTAEQINTPMEVVPIDSFAEAVNYLEQLDDKPR